MQERNSKVSDRNPLPKRIADRPSSYPVALRAASVSDASNEWKKYCDCRLRHFATGR